MTQYFSQKPTVDHKKKTIDYFFGVTHLRLETDSGVFSKDQVDFGSKWLVETVQEALKSEEASRLLELGSGYGPVTLMLAKLFPHLHVHGVEINERAHALSQTNAQLNNINNVSFHLADACQWQGEKDLDVIVTNPPIRAGKAVIQAFVSHAATLLKPSGKLYVVIQKKQGAPSMEKFMGQHFSLVEKINQNKGYWILMGQK